MSDIMTVQAVLVLCMVRGLIWDSQMENLVKCHQGVIAYARSMMHRKVFCRVKLEVTAYVSSHGAP